MMKEKKRPLPKKWKRLGSVQRTYLPIREVQGSVLCLASLRQPRERLYRSILEVTGLNFWLLSEEEQQNIYANLQDIFLSVSFPTQIIARISPLDVNAYLRHLDSASAQPSEAWQELAQNHASWLQEMTKQYTLLERKFYIVVPADDQQVRSRFLRGRRNREEEALTFIQARDQLRLRCDTLSAHLVNMGLHVSEVAGDALVQLYDEMIGGVARSRLFPLTGDMLEKGGETARLDAILAPASVRVERDHLVVDEQEYLRVLAVRGLPRCVTSGFLFRLIQAPEILDVVIHQSPLKQSDAIRMLKRKQGQYESAVLDMESQGRHSDPTTRLAATDVGPLLEQVMVGNEQIHEFSCHVLVRADSKDALEKRAQRVSEIIYTLFHFRPQVMFFEQEVGFKLCLPGNFLLRDIINLNSSSLAAFYPFFSNLVYRPGNESILLGITPDYEPIVINPFELPNYNWFVVGPSGSGKSFAVKNVCQRMYMTYKAREARRNKKEEISFQLFVIDPEREWFRLCDRVNGQWVRLSPGSLSHINPFDLPRSRETQRREEGEIKEDILANQIQMLHHMLDIMLAHHSPDNEGVTLSVQEKALLDAALYETYRRVGITTDPSTHHRTPPLLRDLYYVLSSGDVGQDTSGLASRLRRFVSGSLSGLFAEQTNIDLQRNMVCFDVRELDGELRPVGLMMIANLVWNLSYASMIPRWLIIDELATLCRYKSGELFAREMFRRMRKMYGGVIGITQNIEMFRNSDIISNSAMHILMKQDHSMLPLVAEIFRLSPQEGRYLRTFQKGQALVLVDGKRMVANFVVSPLEYALATTDPRELALFERERQQLAEKRQAGEG